MATLISNELAQARRYFGQTRDRVSAATAPGFSAPNCGIDCYDPQTMQLRLARVACRVL